MPYLTRQKFPVPLDRGKVAQEWGKRGYSCDVFVDPPGREWNDFVHRTNELVVVMDGKLKLDIDGQEIIAEPGDEVFIPKGVCHSVKNVSHASTHWLYGYD
jgi:quercetin dioxygenase-like cupin family protein